MRRLRNTKILATLGPASESPQIIEALHVAGADVFRLNFSHGDYATKQKIFDSIHQTAAKLNRPIGVLGDLQGPKLRVGTFKDGKIPLSIGHKFTFHLNAIEGDEENVQLPHPEIFGGDGTWRDAVLERRQCPHACLRVRCQTHSL